MEITLLLARADRATPDQADSDPAWAGLSPMPVVCGADGCGEASSQFETTPMALHEVGELVFRVQRFRKSAAQWLRGWLRTECMHDAQLLLDSGRLGAAQRGQVARSLLRRLDNLNALVDHW